jgi:large subunit ribosomal protein L15
MVTNKRSKNGRCRGYTSHGFGSMKKNRGAGHRGGRGRAGTGKRGDVKKPSEWKAGNKQGKFGFKSKSQRIVFKTINLKTIEDTIEKLVKGGFAKIQNGSYYLNLETLGYNKLLSTGKVTRKYMITTLVAVPNAIAKIQEAGGNVSTTLRIDSSKKTEEKGKEESTTKTK